MIFLTILDWLSLVLLVLSIFFFVAGTAALVRFPDLYSRLHALTKADNVGLGFTVLAVALHADSWLEVLKLGLVWIMVLVTSACVCFLIANEGRRRGVSVWKGGPP